MSLQPVPYLPCKVVGEPSKVDSLKFKVDRLKLKL